MRKVFSFLSAVGLMVSLATSASYADDHHHHHHKCWDHHHHHWHYC